MSDPKNEFLTRYKNPPAMLSESRMEDFRTDMEMMVGTRHLGAELRTILFNRARDLAVDDTSQEWLAQYQRLVDLLNIRTIKPMTAEVRPVFLKELGDFLTRWQAELGAHQGLVEVSPRNGTDFAITMRVTDENKIVVTED